MACPLRKGGPSFTRAELTGLTRQTIYRIQANPAAAEAALAAWGL